jgi:hypothetical protein
MAAKTPIVLTAGDLGYRVLSVEGFAATDYVDFAAAGIDPSKYREMRAAVNSGVPGADKIRFINRAGGMTVVQHLESAGRCVCPDAVNECGFLRNPGISDTIANITGGGTVDLIVELLP